MSARATWKGLLKISLVTIPIKVYPATETSENLAFNQLHSECQTRIQQRKWCPKCARSVDTAEIVKGFEFEAGKYVLLGPEELDAVQPPSTKVIDLVQFADVAELDPMYIDRTYYLAPDGQGAGVAYAVMAAALVGRVGIGKLALYGREYLIAVRQHPPRLQGRTLMLHTLHHASEIRDLEAIEDLSAVPTRVDPEHMKLAIQVIAAFRAPLHLADFTDQYKVDLQRLIDAKIAGKEIVLAPAIPAVPVVNLREALTQSLQAVAAAKKIPAKVKSVPRRKRA